jgi:dihydroxyacetone kinase phosphoprotein-dependent L subunit
MPSLEVARLSLNNALAAVTAAQDELGQLDAVVGDGDHGIGMVRGFQAAVTGSHDASTTRDLLQQAGAAFSDSAGGASGALVGVLIMNIGKALPEDNIDAQDMSRALEAGLSSICTLGKAKVGDKTMIDTLDPFVRTFAEAASGQMTITQAWTQALVAAEQGAYGTKTMISKRGRAARLGERGRGHLDAGAMSMFYILRAVGEILTEVYAGS